MLINTFSSNNWYNKTKVVNYLSLKINLRHFIVKRCYSQVFNDKVPLITGEIKHFPPANKEWKNSAYFFNKNYLRAMPTKDHIAKKAINQYFSLRNCKHLARSRRMRNLRRKSSLGKIFLSKPEIKQTSDKAIVTVYTLDREKLSILRKIYYNIRKVEHLKQKYKQSTIFNSYENWRAKFSINNSFKKLIYKNFFNRNYPSNSLLRKIYRKYYEKNKTKLYLLKKKRKNLFRVNSNSFKNNKRENKIKRGVPYSGIKLKNELKFLRYVARVSRKNIQARKTIFFIYITRLLSIFNIEVVNLNSKLLLYIKDTNNPFILTTDDMHSNIPGIDKAIILLSNLLNKIITTQGIPVQKLNRYLTKLSGMNFKKYMSDEYGIGTDFNEKKLNNKQLSKLKKELSLINYYINLKINFFKFNKYLPALKICLDKIYNKKAEINIVNLKRLYLNSDIYTQIISNKLRKRVSALSTVINALGLAKIPSEFFEKTDLYNVNNLNSLNIFQSLELDNVYNTTTYDKTYKLNPLKLALKGKENKLSIKDKLQLILLRLYPRSLINQPTHVEQLNNPKVNDTSKKISTKIITVLNSVRYKWVTGVRLEIAGRLTRRFTASKALYKYKYKGSLKDIDYSRQLEYLKKGMPAVKLRNHAKANSQYSLAKSKRRIGAFGVKGWISSY